MAVLVITIKNYYFLLLLLFCYPRFGEAKGKWKEWRREGGGVLMFYYLYAICKQMIVESGIGNEVKNLTLNKNRYFILMHFI